MKIVLDSTVLIELERKHDEAIDLVRSLVAGNEEIIISTVTASELFTGVYYAGKLEKLSDARSLLAIFSPVSLNMEIADKAGQYVAFLLKSGNFIEFKDVAIAATFTVTKSDFLITQNKKHFEALPEIGSKARTISEFRKIYR